MKAHKIFGSSKLIFILFLLIGGLTASAVTLADSTFLPLVSASEGSFLSSLAPAVPPVTASKPARANIAAIPGLTTASSSGKSPALRSIVQTEVDVQGADDEPGQKDLNALSVDYGDLNATEIDVTWNWDDTSTSGNNTRDGGALFDTDGDGNANYVFYITVPTTGPRVQQVFICTSDAKPDRCTGPTLVSSFTSTSSISIMATDPFGPTGSNPTPSHSSGNTCRTRPGCYSDDTVAVADLKLSDFGDVENDEIKLLNVCSYPSGEPNSDPSDCVLAVNPDPGTLTLVKVVNNLGYEGPGLLGVSSFPLYIDGNSTNSESVVNVVAGNHTISEDAVNNYNPGQWSCPGATVTSTVNRTATVTVAPGANVTCTMTNTLDQNFVRRTVSLVKTASPSTYDSVGDIISYSYLVRNTGNVTLAGPVTVVDDKATVTCPTLNPNSLLSNATTTCTASYTITQADLDSGSVTNFATATVDGVDSNQDDETVTSVPDPELQVVKSANPTTYDSTDDVITYTITVTNTGNVTLNNIAVTDALVTNLDCNPNVAGNQTTGFSLAPQDVLTCSATHQITQADLDNGTFANTACADDGAGPAAQDCDDETVTSVPDPELQVVKSANPTTYDSTDDVITYTITVTNTGNVTLNNIAVTDALVTNLDCNPDVAGNQTTGFSLAPQDVLTCSATHQISQADLDNGTFANTACADDGAGPAAQDCDDETVTGTRTPALTIVKDDNGSTYDSVNDVITYSITATNTGNVTLHNVTITDAFATLGTCDAANGSSLAPGGTIVCSATHTVTQEDIDAGTYRNTACVDDGSAAGSAEAVCDDEDTPAVPNLALLLVKTARIKVITYSFVITNVGNTTLSTIGLTDPLFVSDENPTGLLSGCTTLSLAPGGSTFCEADYTVTEEDYTNGFVTNIATATAAGGVLTTATVTITPLTVVSPTPTPTP